MIPSRVALSELRVLHIGGYWRGPNDIVRLLLAGLEEAGPRVVEYDTDHHPEALDCEGRAYDRGTFGPVWLRHDVLAGPLAVLDPHLVICNAGGLSFRPEDARRLRQTRGLLGIALSDPDVHAGTTSRIAPNFDAFVTNAPALVAEYERLGVRSRALPPGTNDRFFRPVPPRPELACQVLVLGRAHPDRVEPVRRLCREFDTHVYGEGWEEHGIRGRGLVFGDEALAALSSAAMTVIFNRTASGYPLLKVGLFDFLAAGALVLTNRAPEVEGLLAFDRELVGFDDTGELLAKVGFLLTHPDEAERIRLAGRARVCRDYSWRGVWQELLAWFMAGSPVPGESLRARLLGWWRR